MSAKRRHKNKRRVIKTPDVPKVHLDNPVLSVSGGPSPVCTTPVWKSLVHRVYLKLYVPLAHKVLHPAEHYLHIGYLGCVALGGPYYYVAGVLAVVTLLVGWAHIAEEV